jgi:hypothetical protein
MAVFSDIESWYAQLEKDIIRELTDIATKIQQDARLFLLKRIYSIPTIVYKRTEMLLNSCEISPVQNKNGEYYIEIFIDPETLHAVNAWYNDEAMGISTGDKMTLAQVAEHIARTRDNADVMESMNEEWLESGRFIDELLDYLHSKYDMLG